MIRLPVDSLHTSPVVRETMNGTPYVTGPGISVHSTPMYNNECLRPFLQSFVDHGVDWDVDDYLNDDPVDEGTAIAKTAGQLCYMSFGKERSRNKDAGKYFDNIRSSKHGSVLEHVNYGFLIWGIGRDFTHELVRHRVGIGYSQLSQRYVSGKLLRFVERVEFQNDPKLHEAFEYRIDKTRAQYDDLAGELKRLINVDGLSKTEARKAVNQAARACLTNEVEAPIIATANIRTWRHIMETRASKHADTPIRRAIFHLGRTLMKLEPVLLADFVADGENYTLTPANSKV